MKIELTDDEWTTVLVALDHYGDAISDGGELYPRDVADGTDSAEWIWQKIFGRIAAERNATADAVGEGEQPQLPFNTQTNSGGSDFVDPFDLGMASQYDNMGDK